MKICVVGMGKLGLPLAIQIANSGFEVIGADIAQDTVEKINNCLEPFPGEHNLLAEMKRAQSAGNFSATTNIGGAISSAQVIIVVVPLVIKGLYEPNFDPLDAVTSEIGRFVTEGSLVIYETTLPIGTLRTRFAVAIEKLSGFRIGDQINLVFSPERVLTGRVFADLRRYPKIVGGITTECTEKGKAFYERVLQFDSRDDLPRPNGVWPVGSCEEAEFVKLAETTYRDVNIGLANQFASQARRMGLDIHKIIESANSQFFSNIHEPGISVGGHCIPVYPYLYMLSDNSGHVVDAARKQNESVIDEVVHWISNRTEKLIDKNVLVLGLAYRPGVKEAYGSGAIQLFEKLKNTCTNVFVHDSIFSQSEIEEMGLNSWDGRNDVHVVILHTAHQEYLEFDFSKFPFLEALVDGRNFYDNRKFPESIEVFTI